MNNMPTIVSHDALEELGKLIGEACDRGDKVNAIAERAGVPPQLISSIKNSSYPNSPTLEKVQAICQAIGMQVTFTKAKHGKTDRK